MTEIKLHQVWSDDGILAIYTMGHIDKWLFAKAAWVDAGTLTILKADHPETKWSVKYIKKEVNHEYIRECDMAEKISLGVEQEFDHYYEWCGSDHPAAFPITSLTFEP